MARIEKTVFISYRRTDVYTALAVYENLKNQGFDVFFDYRSITSGDFEQIITSNIRARAHFVLILTPTALDRCNEPGDWLRREIEIAIDEKRNIVPLFFKGFRFGTTSVSETLTDKLRNLSRYNGLNVHEDYFEEAMQRLRKEFLNVPLNTVLHPVSNTVQKIVREEQVAADKALEQIEDVQKLVKGAEVNLNMSKSESDLKPIEISREQQKEEKKRVLLNPKLRLFVGIASLLIGVPLCIMFGVNYSINNLFDFVTITVTSSPTNASSTTLTSQPSTTDTPSPTETSIPVTPTLGIGSTILGKDDMTLLYIPAGEFTMGSDSDVDIDNPAHTVNLKDFWIDETEVTNAMYARCVDANQCNPPSSTRSDSRSEYFGNPEFVDYPVIYVSWNAANNYCAWVDRRLPTEAEWEKAARGVNAIAYPWGVALPKSNLLNYGTEVRDTTEVGNYPQGASPYGALDMAGNVWEWVADWYHDSYYATPPAPNPLGPNSGKYRVLRGGAWNNTATIVRSANRAGNEPDVSNNELGFRCAMSVVP